MRVSKIKNVSELKKLIKKAKAKKQRIVALSGSFDILHTGHINSFKEAKSLGNILIILLNSDKSIKKYKGPKRPILKDKDRATILSAIEFIDYIVMFDDINPKKILQEIKPDIYCQGCDWGKFCVEKEAVEKNGGEIHILKWEKGYSSSKLIQKILNAYSQPTIKAVFLDRDGTINENNPEYIHKIEDFRFKPKAIKGLKKFSESDYKLIIISNQSGIGRSMYTDKEVKKLHDWLISELARHKVKIDGIYYCPHKPEDNCACRKPKIGLLLKAVKDFDISLNDSWMIGDENKDVLAGKEANIKTIQIKNNSKIEKTNFLPNFFADDLLDAAEIILNKS